MVDLRVKFGFGHVHFYVDFVPLFFIAINTNMKLPIYTFTYTYIMRYNAKQNIEYELHKSKNLNPHKSACRSIS